MEKFFYQLPSNFLTNISDEEWMLYKSEKIFSQYQGYFGCDITYYEIKDLDKFKKLFIRRIFNILPSSVRFTVVSGVNCGLPPHRDHNISTSLNFYINASIKDSTIFYEAKNGEEPYDYNSVATNIYNPVKGNQKNIFRFEQVNEISRFSAENRSAYLLDVNKIHSVDKVSSEPRNFLSFIWKDESYDKILNSLNF